MDKKAENIVQNIGAIAETVSVFYNSISKQVPKDVALVLTQHFMDLTINRPTVNAAVLRGSVATALAAAQDAQRRAMEKKKQEEKAAPPPEDQPENTGAASESE